MPSFTERVPYSAIVDRPPLKLPGGARMAVWTIINVEHWDNAGPMPRTVLPPPMGQPLLPDLPNWAWHEYGMRVGFWRLHEMFGRQGVIPTMAINGICCESYPRIAQAGMDAGWEFMGHGYKQGPMHKLDDQLDAIRRTNAAIAAITGKPPAGWECPGLTETDETIDLLAQEGVKYVADWVLDDQPVSIDTAHGPMISVPYSVEINDIPIFALQNHASDVMYNRTVDHFEQLYRESAEITRVMAISVHPYLSGAPHRIGYLEKIYEHIKGKPDVAMMTGEEIYEWYAAETAGD